MVCLFLSSTGTVVPDWLISLPSNGLLLATHAGFTRGYIFGRRGRPTLLFSARVVPSHGPALSGAVRSDGARGWFRILRNDPVPEPSEWALSRAVLDDAGNLIKRQT